MSRIKITSGKGFHLKFSNGVTVSVQLGWGNYCANRDNDAVRDYPTPPNECASPDAEVAIWCDEWKDWHTWGGGVGDEVTGWVPADEVGDIIAYCRQWVPGTPFTLTRKESTNA